MRFARIFRIQRGEGRLVVLVVGMMFVASAALTIGESGIDALFFDRVGAQALPVMYLLQGAAAFLAMLALTGILGRLGPCRAYLAAPLVLAAAVLGGRLLLVLGAGWVYRLLWIIVTLAYGPHAAVPRCAMIGRECGGRRSAGWTKRSPWIRGWHNGVASQAVG